MDPMVERTSPPGEFEGIEIEWREGRPLEGGNYPGFDPGASVEDGVLIERDVGVELRDGVTIYTDVYRPPDEEGIPALVAWSPYGKRGGYYELDDFPNRVGVPEDAVSEWAKFEGPDPDYWCRHGYAIVNPDARGSWKSEGDLYSFGDQEAADAHDLIEWVAEQSWCAGEVGMTGCSWLAAIQWFTAATSPPHLEAINPWEGFSDLYREFMAPGGVVTEPNRMEWLWDTMFSEGRVEDLPAMTSKYPCWNEYWESKRANLAAIDIPAYVVASWTNQLHPRGTLEGFKRIQSEHKWLRVHDTQEWQDYYKPANVEDRRAFFDHFLKGEDNGWPSTPRVRLSILETADTTHQRSESAWPLARTRHEPLYLHATEGHLSRSTPGSEATVAYDAQAGTAAFEHTFDADTELTGHMSAHLWVEARGGDDMDLFAVVEKYDEDGTEVAFPLIGFLDNVKAARGRVRVSHRELDPERSSAGQPWLTHEREQLLDDGEIVPVTIEFWPFGVQWRAGESLRLVVGGHPLVTPIHGMEFESPRNEGEHVIHTGGQYDSRLVVPEVPESD